MITVLVFVLAAALGALLRAEIGRRLNARWQLPVGTLLVNVAGSFALGALATTGPVLATVLGTAFLGTFTTVSSFARDTAALIENGKARATISYVALSGGLSVAAAWMGLLAVGAI